MSAKPFDSFLRVMPSGCIEWAGVTVKSNGRDTHRYGRVTIGGRKFLAHRVAYERANGPIPTGLCVLHRCDNPKCCNPGHLFLGTQLENIRDRDTKGRCGAKGQRLLGERNGSAKLRDQDVREIRRAYAAGEATTVSLGARYGIHPSCISRIISRKTWAHI